MKKTPRKGRPPIKNKMVGFNIRMPKSMIERIDAKKHPELSRNAFIRIAVEKQLSVSD